MASVAGEREEQYHRYQCSIIPRRAAETQPRSALGRNDKEHHMWTKCLGLATLKSSKATFQSTDMVYNLAEQIKSEIGWKTKNSLEIEVQLFCETLFESKVS